jgi:hypothetical protein
MQYDPVKRPTHAPEVPQMDTYASTATALTSLLEAARQVIGTEESLLWARDAHAAGELHTNVLDFERDAITARAVLAGVAARYAAAYDAQLREEAAYVEATGR